MKRLNQQGALKPLMFASLLSLSTFTSADINDATVNDGKVVATETSSVSANSAENTSPLNLNQIAERYIPEAEAVGEARLKIMFWKIYDAKLVASKGQWQANSPFALSLTYLRDFDGEDIASRSVDEMRDIGYEDEVELAKWYEQMRSVFPNVKEGENITGVLDTKKHTHFYYQGKLIGSIDDISFGQSFFDIWLHKNTSEPEMRKQLLGMTKD
ncbi:chalcone isomerase family protein [Brumicola blandensis]|uniref:Chalcone isomerase family protein n=1 Tax=Brumicola blandensis TaxID=3075611 RepID=A0AAW8R4A5_9ALTE|nr:chalcone isomerase family protein [Alteromonas sp. W409]MDT0583192.1 chalcone isomerase family protein [Alteromonas sp. W409]